MLNNCYCKLEALLKLLKCSDCQATLYIIETGRLTMWLKQTQMNYLKSDLNNNIIAEHHLKTGLTICWDSATCVLP